MQNDNGALGLMKRIERENAIDLEPLRHQKVLDKLIKYGIVNKLLNNTIVLSGIGLKVLRNLEKE